MTNVRTPGPEIHTVPHAAVRPLTIGLGEYDTGWHAPQASLASAEAVVARAAGVGAQLVALPEMATTGFTMDPERAVAADAPEVARLGQIAARHEVWLVAGVALREEAGPVNAALVFDPTGALVAAHRKQRLFAFAGEDAVYRPGTHSTVVTMHGVRVALFICYELRFPELFRAVADEADLMVVIANWPAARRAHWDALLQARAIENQCAVVGVNRIGVGGGLGYDGGSAAYSAWGERLHPVGTTGVRIVTIDPADTADVRARYPFLRDR